MPFGSIEEQALFEKDDWLRIIDDSSSDNELLQNHINFWLDLHQLRSISYKFCKNAAPGEVANFERYVKTRDFIDSASKRWGDFRIVRPGPFDNPGTEVCVWTDGVDGGGSASLARKLTPEETITYREVFDDYRWISSEFLKAQG